MEGVKCKSCHRTFDDLEQWLYMSKEAREYRMEQIKRMLEASGDCV